jgi:cytochrome c oxidase cbb3-type subunit 3
VKAPGGWFRFLLMLRCFVPRGGCAAVLALLTAAVVGCDPLRPPSSAETPVRSDRVLDFATLYRQNCAGCHGADGQFGPAPPLNDPLFLAIVPDEVLLGLVANGRPGTLMPAFSRARGGSLTDEQVRALALGVKEQWKADRPAKAPLPAYVLPEKPGNADRGSMVFEHSCASCHGDEGLGGEDKVGPIHDPAFLALISDQAVRRYVITGRRDLKMPDYAGTDGRESDFQALSAEEIADVVAYVSSWRSAAQVGRAEGEAPR